LDWCITNHITLHTGQRVTAVDRTARTVTAGDRIEPYDVLLFATGSKPFVPPMEGLKTPGVFVFRTIDDCRQIASYAAGCQSAIVIGGGLLGLEAARGLLTHNVSVTVVGVGPYLMGVQLDPTGGALLHQTITNLGITALCGAATTHILGGDKVTGIRLKDGRELPADMVVISAGIRANLELARDAGLATERGIIVDDRMATADEQVFAVGECAQHRGMVYGLVAPIWEQTKVLAQVLTDTQSPARYTGSKLATKLKVLGVELASMGRVTEVKDTDEVVQYVEPSRGVYQKIVVRAGKINAACMLGEIDTADVLMRLYQTDGHAPTRRPALRTAGDRSGGGIIARGFAGRAASVRLQRREQGHDLLGYPRW
jgi:nitrite reductase (NADH) large subunit